MSEITTLRLNLAPTLSARENNSLLGDFEETAHPDRRLRIAFLIMVSLNAFVLSGAFCLVLLCYLRF